MGKCGISVTVILDIPCLAGEEENDGYIGDSIVTTNKPIWKLDFFWPKNAIFKISILQLFLPRTTALFPPYYSLLRLIIKFQLYKTVNFKIKIFHRKLLKRYQMKPWHKLHINLSEEYLDISTSGFPVVSRYIYFRFEATRTAYIRPPKRYRIRPD